MDSEQELPPILPRKSPREIPREIPRSSHNYIEAYSEGRMSLVEGQEPGFKKDNGLYDKVPMVKPRRYRRYIACVAIFIAVLVISCILLVLRLTSKTSSESITSFKNATSHAMRAVSAEQASNPPPHNVLKAIGSGGLIMHLFAGEIIHPWEVESRHGNCSLEKKRFIVVQPEGKYRIYCKVTFHKKPTVSTVRMTRDGKASTVAKGFGVNGTFEFNGVVFLKSGDRLSINVKDRAAVIMNKGEAYFHVKQI